MTTEAPKVRLSDCIAPSFIPVHFDIKDGLNDEYILKGGRGSTKSSFVPIQIIMGMMRDPEANALCIRKGKVDLRESVQEFVIWAINMLGVQDYWDVKTSPASATYIPTGQKIIYRGLDKASKLKSIKLNSGYFKYLWFEEAEEFGGIEEIRNVRQSVKRGGEKFVEFVTYNPPDDVANWCNVEFSDPQEGQYIHHSTYLDVPSMWLGNKFLSDAEKLKKRDYDKYRHEYLGEVVGRTDKIIFNGRWIERECAPTFDDVLYFGADWGFANDPTCLVRSWIRGDTLYVDYAEGGVGIETDRIKHLFDKVPMSRKYTIRGDSARPETISFLVRDGFSIIGAKKGKGSVEDGIEWLRGFNIVVHPRCKMLIKELTLYSYQINKNGDILPKAEDANNHAIDALRYAYEPLISNKGGDFIEL